MSTEFVLSPRFRRSPFYEATVRHGVKGFSIYNKTYLPMGFTDPETEFWQLVDGVALWDVAGQRIVEISGPDGFAFANLLVPRDLNKSAVGQCKYVVVTAPDGGILNDPVLLRLEENRFWLSRADSDILMWAQGVAVFAGMDVEVREPDVGTLQLQGPKSRDVAVALFGADVAELAYYDLVETALDGMPLVVARTGWSAELGYEIYLRDTARADELWEAIMAAGSAHGIAPGCPSRIRRIEAGIYDYSVDIDAAINPFEVGLGRLVDLDQENDFIGKAALRRIAAEGVTRKLVGIEVDGAPLHYNDYRWPATRGATAIGHVTSCVYSPRLEKNIGFAMLDLAHSALGTEIEVAPPDGPRRAVVVEKPFFDPKKHLSRD